MNTVIQQMNFSPIHVKLDLDFKKVSQILIEENDEPLVELSPTDSQIKVVPIYANQGIPGAIKQCYVRQSVYLRLLNVINSLPASYKLVVLDSWRPTRVQQHLFDTLKESIRATSPYIEEAELLQKTLEFVAKPSTDVKSPSFHLTGGSVDVTLSDANGKILDMGSLFDEAIPQSHTAYLESKQELTYSERMAQNNRRCLYWAMIDQGFTNLDSEWWHYDFGNQLWAYYTENKRAIYGPTSPKELMSDLNK